QRARRRRPEEPVGVALALPDHAGPTPEREQRLEHEVAPPLPRDAELAQGVDDRRKCGSRASAERAQELRKRLPPLRRSEPGGSEDVREALQEAFVAPGQRPLREALVEKRAAEG